MLGAFRDFLIERAVVRENHVPYYIKWVAACYVEIGEPSDEIVSTGEKAGFLGRMSANHQDWQVAQADDALRLYEYFLTSQRNVVAAPGVSRMMYGCH